MKHRTLNLELPTSNGERSESKRGKGKLKLKSDEMSRGAGTEARIFGIPRRGREQRQIPLADGLLGLRLQTAARKTSKPDGSRPLAFVSIVGGTCTSSAEAARTPGSALKRSTVPPFGSGAYCLGASPCQALKILCSDPARDCGGGGSGGAGRAGR